ncbi:MAG: diaminopimelate epimerase [Candidatus Sumerlaeaceae bacterium]
MTMELEFWKLSGAGNDFVAINNMDGRLPEEGRHELIAAWCLRGMSIGADGALILEPAAETGAHFRMRYYNADGGEAETCGNGSRCIARFAHLQGIAPGQMTFETMCGNYDAEVLRNGEVRIRMTDAHSRRDNIRISDDVFEGELDFLNTGVPHIVTQVDELANTPVQQAGKHLRHHSEFAPAGTNVNFVRLRDPRNLEVRTYERGVEAETLACGTGCIASAITFARLGLVEPPVRVKTASGEYLTINFELTQDGACDVTLQGSAHVVFRGYIEVPQLAETVVS